MNILASQKEHPLIIIFDFDGVILNSNGATSAIKMMMKNPYFEWDYSELKNHTALDIVKRFEKFDSASNFSTIKKFYQNFSDILPGRYKRLRFFYRIYRDLRKIEYEHGDFLSGIPDIAKNGGAKIVAGKPVENLDDLPFPDFSLMHGFKKRLRYTPVSTSRGCPFECNFCSVTAMFGRKYRFRSTESVIEEISRIKHRHIFFYDDNFDANKSRLKTLLTEMIRRKLTPGWTAQVRADVADDEEL